MFQRTLVPETINIETLTLAVAVFAAYGLAVAAGWCLLLLCCPSVAEKWFWPDDTKAGRYRLVTQVNGGLSLAFVALVARASPGWLLGGAAFVSIAALAATFAIVRLSSLPSSSSSAPHGSWRNDFLLARVSFLFAVAAIPAFASFQIAYTSRSSLVARRGQTPCGEASSTPGPLA